MQEVCILFTVYFILLFFFFIIGLKNYFNILSSTHFYHRRIMDTQRCSFSDTEDKGIKFKEKCDEKLIDIKFLGCLRMVKVRQILS